jgi:hypothetical protein
MAHEAETLLRCDCLPLVWEPDEDTQLALGGVLVFCASRASTREGSSSTLPFLPPILPDPRAGDQRSCEAAHGGGGASDDARPPRRCGGGPSSLVFRPVLP